MTTLQTMTELLRERTELKMDLLHNQIRAQTDAINGNNSRGNSTNGEETAIFRPWILTGICWNSQITLWKYNKSYNFQLRDHESGRASIRESWRESSRICNKKRLFSPRKHRGGNHKRGKDQPKTRRQRRKHSRRVREIKSVVVMQSFNWYILNYIGPTDAWMRENRDRILAAQNTLVLRRKSLLRKSTH